MTQQTGLPQNFHNTPVSDTQAHREREQIWFIINRAYQNIYGMNLPSAPAYQKTIFDAAQSLKRDPRSRNFSDRMFIQICEDIIRISDEHARLASSHQSRANNPVYLRETAIDNAIEKEKYLVAIGARTPASTVVMAQELPVRVASATEVKLSSSDILELAYQQLAATAG